MNEKKLRLLFTAIVFTLVIIGAILHSAGKREAAMKAREKAIRERNETQEDTLMEDEENRSEEKDEEVSSGSLSESRDPKEKDGSSLKQETSLSSETASSENGKEESRKEENGKTESGRTENTGDRSPDTSWETPGTSDHEHRYIPVTETVFHEAIYRDIEVTEMVTRVNPLVDQLDDFEIRKVNGIDYIAVVKEYRSYAVFTDGNVLQPEGYADTAAFDEAVLSYHLSSGCSWRSVKEPIYNLLGPLYIEEEVTRIEREPIREAYEEEAVTGYRCEICGERKGE